MATSTTVGSSGFFSFGVVVTEVPSSMTKVQFSLVQYDTFIFFLRISIIDYYVITASVFNSGWASIFPLFSELRFCKGIYQILFSSFKLCLAFDGENLIFHFFFFLSSLSISPPFINSFCESLATLIENLLVESWNPG